MTAPAPPRVLKIAILAMGGEGGGVLADWLVALGEDQGYLAQATSVPGVAQRTGATLYYVELFPAAAAQAAGRAPVLALMPAPGDVDIVLASELMEAARAVQRGLVTPDRTVLLASTHRVYAIAEKVALHDGRADPAALLGAAQATAQRFVGFDMAEAAEAHHSVVSAVLFGALAGCGALPFARQAFEATIERGGLGVRSSLAAFAVGFERASTAAAVNSGECTTCPSAPTPAPPPAPAAALPRSSDPAVQALLDKAASAFEGQVLGRAIDGLRRVVDYQDPAYGAQYLDRLAALQQALGPQADTPDGRALLETTAVHLALWMSFEDTLRIADLKTRGSRFDRVRQDVRAGAQQALHIDDYLHPRLQEVAETLPPALGRWLLRSGSPRRWVEGRFSRGRVLRTSSLRGFLPLALLASLRRWRRRTLRYQIEQQRIDQWLADIHRAAVDDLALATEIVRCQGLVAGYGDTHHRGWQHYLALRHACRTAPARVSAADLQALREAALQDDRGNALQAALSRLGVPAMTTAARLPEDTR